MLNAFHWEYFNKVDIYIQIRLCACNKYIKFIVFKTINMCLILNTMHKLHLSEFIVRKIKKLINI